ncbi:MAG: hypothetical protein P8Z71_05845 [Candidatus Sulfobium sp.]
MDKLDKEILERKLRKLALFLFFLVVFLSFIYPVRDPDTPWHVKTGEYILTHGTIPMSSDPFSFATEKIPFVGRFILSQNWIAQVLFFIIYRSWGPFGLVLTRAVVFTLIVSIIWYLIEHRKGFFIALPVAGTVAFLIHRYFTGIRAQIFTFLFAAALIFLIEKYRETKSVKWLAVLPFLMFVWANMHGGFIYGIVLILIYLFGEGAGIVLKGRFASYQDSLSARQFVSVFAAGLLSVLFSLLNPNTYKAFVYTFMTHSPHFELETIYSQMIQEYQSALAYSRMNPSAMTYGFWACVVCAVVMGIVFLRRRQVTPLLLLIFAVTPALLAARYIPLFLIVAAPLVTYLPPTALRKPSTRLRIGSQIVIIAFLSFLAVYSNPFRSRDILRFNENYHYPVRATDFLLKNDIRGNIFASYNTAAFILFRCYPGSRIYSDSRFIDVKRIIKSLEIEGALDPPGRVLASINRLLPPGIGTIKVSGGGEESGGKGSRDEAKWKKLLDKINADIIVHEAVNHFTGGIYPLIFKLAQDNTWKLIDADGTVMIFVRDEPKFRDVIARYQLPKSRIYDEILEECLMGAGHHREAHYSSMAIALLLKGIANKRTSSFIDTSLSLSPNSYIGNYSKALFLLMTHKKKAGA